MLEVHCAGSPREIGLEHGKAAHEQILRGLQFYKAYYVEKASLEWPRAVEAALKFMPLLDRDWPDFVVEMQGDFDPICHPFAFCYLRRRGGRRLAFQDILAMNVRSEISMGMMTMDGCTALSYHTPSTALLAQNWDWDIRQQTNIIALTISPTSGPKIAMITEAGLIGKIGFNSHSVGVCLNAIRTPGVSFAKLPLHLALRAALNSTSAAAAIAVLETAGVASAGHILIADQDGGTGLEWSHLGVSTVLPRGGVVAHTNHFLEEVPVGVGPGVVVEDSPVRMLRIVQLLRGVEMRRGEVGVVDVESMLDDEQGFPCSINRSAAGGEGLQTLFSIVMDLRERRGWVRVGRPTESGERVALVI